MVVSHYKLTMKSVNSKSLANEITDFIENGMDINSWDILMHRESYISMLNEWMEEIANSGKIEQWKVICDKRNNKQEDMKKGTFYLDVYYKQKHCLNMTQLHYEIKTTYWLGMFVV